MNNLLLLLLSILASSATAARRNCYTNSDLWSALAAALPGDDIVLYAGTSPFSGHYYTNRAGTAAQPITLRSADPSNKSIIRGLSVRFFDPTLYIEGDYWTVKDLVIENGYTGIIFDKSIGGKILNCKVHTTGEAGIHIRDGSSQFLIDGNTVENTGLVQPGFGEGIYLGSDRGVHRFFDPTVTNIVVTNNMIGPNVRAEGMDVREGTRDILIENNMFDATGVSAVNSADSFIDLKGSHSIVRGNMFKQNGAPNMNKGINVIDRDVSHSSFDHVIIGNTFDFDSDSIPMVQANRNTEDIYVKDNIRIPSSGADYSGTVTRNRVPDWYTATLVGVTAVTSTPRPSLRPTPSPTPRPSARPTRSPTPLPSGRPTRSPTPLPSPRPSPQPVSLSNTQASDPCLNNICNPSTSDCVVDRKTSVASCVPIRSWWNDVVANFDARSTGAALKQCGKRGAIPPANGEDCGLNLKACFFGTQDCSPIASTHPVTKCTCENEVWQCTGGALTCPTAAGQSI